MTQTTAEKQELAWLTARKQALLHLFGYHLEAQLLPLDEEALQLAALSLFHQAIQAGRFTHGTFIEDALDEIMCREQLERRIPYGVGFAAAFAQYIAALDLPEVIEQLAQVSTEYDRACALFFKADAGGYQYLGDVLQQAHYARTVPPTPSLQRAIHWLHAQAGAQAGAPAVPAAAGVAVLANGHTWREVEEVLVAVGLLRYSAEDGVCVTPSSTPSGWVGATTALREARYLNHNKAALALALQTLYGKVVSARALQNAFKPDNEAQNAAYNLTQAVLKQG